MGQQEIVHDRACAFEVGHRLAAIPFVEGVGALLTQARCKKCHPGLHLAIWL